MDNLEMVEPGKLSERNAGEENKSSQYKILGFILDLDTKEDVLTHMADYLYSQGFVCQDYGAAVLDREKEFPTGLPTTPVCIAIPHCDMRYVLHGSIAAAKLNHPVVFKNMGAPAEDLNVDLILLLAVPQDDEQVLIIQRIMEVVQSQEALMNLMNSKTDQELVRILDGYINYQPV
jgi:PTS system galactitol-specific IIA component